MEPLNTEEKIENTQQTLEKSLENPSEALKETVEDVEKGRLDKGQLFDYRKLEKIKKRVLNSIGKKSSLKKDNK